MVNQDTIQFVRYLDTSSDGNKSRTLGADATVGPPILGRRRSTTDTSLSSVGHRKQDEEYK